MCDKVDDTEKLCRFPNCIADKLCWSDLGLYFTKAFNFQQFIQSTFH